MSKNKMTDEEFGNAVLKRLEDIRALYKQHCPNAFVPEDDKSGYLSLTIFNDAVFFSNGGPSSYEKYGINGLDFFKRIDN